MFTTAAAAFMTSWSPSWGRFPRGGDDNLGTKGGKPGSGFLVGWLLGVLGVLILAAATPRQTEIDSAARSEGLVWCPHCGAHQPSGA